MEFRGCSVGTVKDVPARYDYGNCTHLQLNTRVINNFVIYNVSFDYCEIVQDSIITKITNRIRNVMRARPGNKLTKLDRRNSVHFKFPIIYAVCLRAY